MAPYFVESTLLLTRTHRHLWHTHGLYRAGPGEGFNHSLSCPPFPLPHLFPWPPLSLNHTLFIWPKPISHSPFSEPPPHSRLLFLQPTPFSLPTACSICECLDLWRWAGFHTTQASLPQPKSVPGKSLLFSLWTPMKGLILGQLAGFIKGSGCSQRASRWGSLSDSGQIQNIKWREDRGF